MVLTKFLFNHLMHNEHVGPTIVWYSWTDASLLFLLYELSKQLATGDV